MSVRYQQASVLRGILKEEEKRLRELLRMYAQEIRKLPRGSVSLKRIRHGEYAYLAYRKGGRVRFDYLGSAKSEDVAALKAKVDERRRLEGLMRRAKRNLLEVERMLRVRAV
jgi:hypothetical protein